MCGIAGIFNLEGSTVNASALKKFTDALKHRGPDGSGYELYNNDTIGFGHRRLSILDLTDAGKQPMEYLERYSITFNGEVFNFLEIREELIQKGYKFKTNTDTEVVLAAYNEYGEDCLLKFNGMWAFALWDKKESKLFLARDRYGVKPLHFVYLPGKLFAFASETIAFKHLEGFKRRFNKDHLITAIQNSSFIEASGKTIFENIEQLLPGHSISISADKKVNLRRWWNTADHLVDVNKDYGIQIEEFKDLFFNACKIRMRSDVPLASALSGGLDSSSVYCTLQQFKKRSSELKRLPADWQKAFVATFPGTTMDERKYAEEVINYTKGSAVYITPDYSNLVSDITTTTQLFDGIIGSPLIATSDIYKAMRKNGVVVSLDGHGADEYAFGYTYYTLDAFYEAVHSGKEKAANEYAEAICQMSPAYNKEKLMETYYSGNTITSKIKRRVKFVLKSNGISNVPRKNNWFHSDTIVANELSFFSNPFKGITRKLFNDFHYNSLPINLRDFDRASMQNGVEIRMPFMDYRLVNYMFSLPQESKLGGGFTKRIIRDAMKGIVPEPIRTRKLKIGIGSPITEWMAGPLKEMVNDTFASQRFLSSELYNTTQIRSDVENNYKNNSWNSANASQTWCILNALLINE